MAMYLLPKFHSRKIHIGLMGAVLLIQAVVCANAEEKPVQMSMSYISHPVITGELIPLIEQSYRTLGIKTIFTEQPSAKNLKLVSEGVSDAEVAYSELLLEGYPNLVMVGPPLVTSVFVLLCVETVTCEASQLSDPNLSLVLTAASLAGMKSKYAAGFKIKPYVIKRLQDVPKLLSQKRFTRGIYVITDRQLGLAEFEELKYSELFTSGTYHIINSKFSFMKEEIDQAIRETLREKQPLNTSR